MEKIVTFKFSLVDGTKEEQSMTVPAEELNRAVQQAMVNFANLGILIKDNKLENYKLIPAHRIESVEATVFSLTLSNPGDVNKAVAQSEQTKKIIAP